MGYVTEERLPEHYPQGMLWKNGAPYPAAKGGHTDLPGTGTTYRCYQKTTSWRTGVRDPSNTNRDVEDNALFSASTQGAVFGALAAQQQNARQSKYDTGHTFETIKREVICTPNISTSWDYLGTKFSYDGVAYTSPSTKIPLGFGGFPGLNEAYYGPDAIGRTLPTNPLVDLTVALAELKREGFPKPGSALYRLVTHPPSARLHQIDDAFYTMSDELLAYQFGLMPVLKDLNGMKEALLKAQALIEQHVRDSGKIIRRKFEYEPIKTSEVLAQGGTNASLNLVASLTTSEQNAAWVGGINDGPHYLSLTTTREVSFSGGYTYHLEVGDDLLSTIERIDELSQMLIGHRVDSSTMWNLTPWSWLADWNWNFGRNLSNAESFSRDGLVIAYGYLMYKDTRSYHSVVHGPAIKNNGPKGPFNTIYSSERKVRTKASPFGFGVVPGSFTTRQWAILGALGYTKGGNTLRTDS